MILHLDQCPEEWLRAFPQLLLEELERIAQSLAGDSQLVQHRQGLIPQNDFKAQQRPVAQPKRTAGEMPDQQQWMPIGRCMALQCEGIKLFEQTAQLRTSEALDKPRPGHPPLTCDSTAQHLKI